MKDNARYGSGKHEYSSTASNDTLTALASAPKQQKSDRKPRCQVCHAVQNYFSILDTCANTSVMQWIVWHVDIGTNASLVAQCS